jgi:hypothetical protein
MTEVTPPPSSPRLHKATYASDKKKGGYLVRVEGPNAGRFVGRAVPVVTMSGKESMEELVKLLWTGADENTGKPVALYTFKARPRDEELVGF